MAGQTRDKDTAKVSGEEICYRTAVRAEVHLQRAFDGILAFGY